MPLGELLQTGLTAVQSKLVWNLQEPIADSAAPEHLAEEIHNLGPERCLAQNGDLAVYRGTAREMPQLMREIGRLRELTFRKVGEGTGKSLDLDRFDNYYEHLLLWHRSEHELIGAYRAGNTAEILPRHGIDGLYTSTLFRYDERIFQRLGPALELGRSFIRPEYQRQYAPLLLLWKAIAQLVAQRPETPILFGAVSISNDYNIASREMIYHFFEAHMQQDNLARLIKPRRPFRPARLRRRECREVSSACRDLNDLSESITAVEPDGKGLPILLRQYAKIGGKMISFNVDRKFSNALDGLVVVDLRQTDPEILERYMGREAAARFRQLHGVAV